MEKTVKKSKRIQNLYELSPMQAGMFFHYLSHKDSQAYVEQQAFNVKGEIDVSLCEKSFNALIQRYDILRTVFVHDKLDEPVQIVLKERRYTMPFRDVSHLSPEEMDAAIDSYKRDDRKKGFDLSRELLTRMAVFKRGSRSYTLIWTFHHIIMDGWCLAIVFKEFMHIYRALQTGSAHQLEPVVQYVSYIKWLQKQDKAAGLKYWQDYLSGYDQPAGLPMPVTGQTGSYRLAVRRFKLGEDVSARLDAVAVQCRSTMNTVFQALWGILLQKYNNTCDVVFGTIVSGRPPDLPDVEKIVGLFINAVPVRIHVPGDTTFSRMVEHIHMNAVNAKSYEYLPLAEIQADSLLKNRLFDHILVYENYPVQQEVTHTPGISTGFVVEGGGGVEQTGYDFDVTILPGTDLEVVFSFNADVYPDDLMRRCEGHLKTIITQVTASHDPAVDAIEVVTPVEKQTLLKDFNDTYSKYPMDRTFQQLFAEQVRKTPDAAAVVSEHEPGCGSLYITYRDLNRKAACLAEQLKDKGIHPGEIIAVMAQRSSLVIIGVLAVLKAGAAYLPIDPELPDQRIRFMLEDSRAPLLMTTASSAEKVNFPGEVFVLESALETASQITCHPSPVEEPGNEDGLAYVIYTSGSTGMPKGVMVEHRQLVNAAYAWREVYHLDRGDIRLLQMASFSFDVFTGDLCRALLNGGQLVLCPSEFRADPVSIYALMAKYRITILEATPGLIIPFMDHVYDKRLPVDFLELLIIGSDICRMVDFIHLVKRFGGDMRIINSYGVTEATIDSSFYEAGDAAAEDTLVTFSRNTPIGKPLPNMTCHILDAGLNLLPVGVPGELVISGSGVAAGYVNNPQLTAERFISGNSHPFHMSHPSYPSHLSHRSYKTGDLARRLPDGNIEFLGRIDHQVKIRGFRIELGEIENHLKQHAHITDAIVAARDDGTGDKYLCAYIVPRTNSHLYSNQSDQTEIRTFLSQRVPDYMIPVFFVLMDAIPLSPNGKVDRRLLPEPGIPSSRENITVPVGSVEEKMTALWSDLLKREMNSFGTTDNFFHLGGHSLKATLLSSRIGKEFNVDVSIARIFETPTIKELSEYVAESALTIYRGITAVEKKEYHPQSSAQKRLFFLDRFEDIGTSYNMPLFLRCSGPLDNARFDAAMRQLVERYETLRTSFHMIDDQPVQRVHDAADISFAVEYFHPPVSISDEERLVREFIRPFDLSVPPLLRVRLLEFSRREHAILFDMHHIITDGTSEEVLKETFLNLYAGETPEPLTLQYKDFSSWQNHLFRSCQVTQQEEYWLNLFSDARTLPVLDLPTDTPRPAIFDFKGDTYAFSIPAELSLQFKQLVGRSGATVYMGLLTTFYILLQKYTGQEDFIVGCGIAGRRHADLQDIIGLFVNMLAIRSRFDGQLTFMELLMQVKQACLDAFENQDLQFEELVDRLDPPRDASRNPLFDVALVNQNFRQAEGESSELTFAPYKTMESNTSRFDATFFAMETPTEIRFVVEYYSSIFKKETIQRMTAHYVTLLEQAVRDPQSSIAAIQMLSETEKRQLLMDFNHTRTEYPTDRTIVRLFSEQVQRTPDNDALVGYNLVSGTNETLTYRQLDQQSNRWANFLREDIGIRPNEPVGLMMERSVELITAILGILKAGGAYVPMALTVPPDRLKRMIDDAAIHVMVSQKKMIKTLNRLQWDCPTLHTFICPDSFNIDLEDETETSELMDSRLWEYVGETATDDITGGGWLSSYTGKPIPAEEMIEYGENIYKKLSPLLHDGMRVLEIGCASGITMFRLAPEVGFYYGTDLSQVIIRKNREKVEQEGHRNISLSCLAAHEIDQLTEGDFDLVIINSVIQCFSGHNYLRKVIGKIIRLMAPKGLLFIGDIMDRDLRDTMIADLESFRRRNRDKNIKTKVDWSEELFISRSFLEDLAADFHEITGVGFSGKLFTLENELTRYRYDALIHVDKSPGSTTGTKNKHKYRYDARGLDRHSTEPPTVLPSPDHLAYIIYTSGSTGMPKGVPIRHRNLSPLLHWGYDRLGIGVGDRTLHNLAVYFDWSVWEIFITITGGATLYIVPDDVLLNPGECTEFIETNRLTVLHATPTQLGYLLNENPNLESLRYLFIGAEKLTHDPVTRSFRAVDPQCRVFNMYGPTEATIISAVLEIQRDTVETYRQLTSIPIGTSPANVKSVVLDPYFNVVPVNVAGELYIGGDCRSIGYLNRPELTANKFISIPPFNRGSKGSLPLALPAQGPSESPPGGPPEAETFYRTGDRVRRLADGTIEFLGRFDHQVKIRGYRIELGEIEKNLVRIDGVKEAVVTEAEDEDFQKSLVAFVVFHMEKGDEAGIADLRTELSKRLPPYMIPSHIVGVAAIPLTPNGKVDLAALRNLRQETTKGPAEPMNETENKLAVVWAEVLGIKKERIGRESDFFQLGGHSLKATVLVSRLQKEMQVKLPLAEIFKAPYVRDMAAYIDKSGISDWEAIQPAPNGQDYYPQSSAQKRLFFLDRMEDIGTSYNMPNILTVEGQLEIERLETIARELIRRHETLRTSFHLEDNEPVQKIHDHRQVDFRVEHFEIDTVDIDDAAGIRECVNRFVRPFDLSQAPLFRVGMAVPAAGPSLLMMDMHHIISDGTSMQIMMDEVTRLYIGETLPELTIQYKDFACWQNRLFESGKIKEQESYWLDLFGDIARGDGTDVLPAEFPTDFPRPETRDFTGAGYEFILGKVETDALKEMAAQNGATLFMNLLAAFNLLVYKYTNSEDIIIGSGIAGRRHADLQRIIGFFINVLPYRNYPRPQLTYENFLQEVKDNCLKAFENQDFQFEEMVRRLKLDRDTSRNPLFDVIFTLQNIDTDVVAVDSDLTFSLYKDSITVSQFDMSIDIFEKKEGLEFRVEYAAALFKPSTIEKIAGHYLEIIDHIIQQKDILLRDIQLSHSFIDAAAPVEDDDSDFGF